MTRSPPSIGRGTRPSDEALLRIARECPSEAIELRLDGELVEL